MGIPSKYYPLSEYRDSVAYKRFLLQRKDDIARQADPEAFVLAETLRGLDEMYDEVYLTARDALVTPFVGQLALGGGLAAGEPFDWRRDAGERRWDATHSHGVYDIELRDMVGVTYVWFARIEDDGTRVVLYEATVHPSDRRHRIPLALHPRFVPDVWFVTRPGVASFVPRSRKHVVMLNDGGSATLFESHLWFTPRLERAVYGGGEPRYYVDNKVVVPRVQAGNGDGGCCGRCSVM